MLTLRRFGDECYCFESTDSSLTQWKQTFPSLGRLVLLLGDPGAVTLEENVSTNHVPLTVLAGAKSQHAWAIRKSDWRGEL